MALDPDKFAQMFKPRPDLSSRKEVLSQAATKRRGVIGSKVKDFFRDTEFGRTLKESFIGVDKPTFTEEEKKKYFDNGEKRIPILSAAADILKPGSRSSNTMSEKGVIGSLMPSFTETKSEKVQRRAEKLVKKDGIDEMRAYRLATEDVYLGPKGFEYPLPKPNESPKDFSQRMAATQERLGVSESEKKRLSKVRFGERASLALDAENIVSFGFGGTVAKKFGKEAAEQSAKKLIPKLKSVGADLLDDVATKVSGLTDVSKVKEELSKVFHNVSDDVAEAFTMVDDKLQVKQAIEGIERQATSKPLIDFDKIVFPNAEARHQAEVWEQTFRGVFRPDAGKVVTRADVKDAMKQAEILARDPLTFEKNKQLIASIQKTSRSGYEDIQQFFSATKSNDPETAGKLIKSAVDKLVQVKDEGSSAGRLLESFKMLDEERPAFMKLVDKVNKSGKNVEDLISKLSQIDVNDAKALNRLELEFFEPTWGQILDSYRYINVLSSPITQIVNITSTAGQAIAAVPGTRLINGVFDSVASILTRRQRSVYAREVPQYIRGAINAIPESIGNAWDAFRGKTVTGRLDMSRVNIADTDIKKFIKGGDGVLDTANRLAKTPGLLFSKVFRSIPGALDGFDVFFKGIIQAGEETALAYRGKKLGSQIPGAAKQAEEFAKEMVFRRRLDTSNATGQGYFLTGIDKLTDLVSKAREVAPAVLKIPLMFIETPMNIFKQGIEYSPLGLVTVPGNTNKQLQAAKAAFGSMVPATLAALDMSGEIEFVWEKPTDPESAQAFSQAGRIPFSIRIGDNYYSYARLGPLAYPLAMYGSFKWHMTQNPDNVDESIMTNLSRSFGGVALFFSQQSYMEGIGNLVDLVKGRGQGENAAGAGLASFLQQGAQQIIPLVSALRWANRLTDNTIKDIKDDNAFKKEFNRIVASLPFASQTLNTLNDQYGNPLIDPQNIANAFSPLKIGEFNAEAERLYQIDMESRYVRENRTKATKELNKEADQVVLYLDSLPKDQANAEFQRLEAYDEELADKVFSKIRSSTMTPEQKMLMKLQVGTGDRARFIHQNIMSQYSTNEQKARKFQELKDSGIISKTVEEQIWAMVGK